MHAVLHTFDGSSLLNPSIINNVLFSNTFPRRTNILRGSLDGLSANDTIGDIFGSLMNWDLGAFDLREKKPWDKLAVGEQSALRGAGEDLTGLFTQKLPKIPDILKKYG